MAEDASPIVDETQYALPPADVSLEIITTLPNGGGIRLDVTDPVTNRHWAITAPDAATARALLATQPDYALVPT
ncbi:hypothetical protein Q0M94_28265 (plasmid) [Deinococcus radiomollis]|uniref:hypothetical protein n=1 Tax=Deinococcus radiomollis TaxID=468916 RepID=UPI0038927B67